MHDFARIDAALDANAGQPAGVGERDAEGLALARPAGDVSEPADGTALDVAHGAGVVVRPDGFRSVFGDGRLQARGDEVERVVPSNRLELSAALGADSAQRVHQAIGVVHAFGIARDLGADDAIRVRLRRPADAADALGRKALDIQRANAGAIVRADAAHRDVGLGHPAMVAGPRTNDD